MIKSYTLSIITFIIIFLSFVAILQLNVGWDTWRIATCMPDDCFCEAIRPNTTIRQPANTWSSLVFTLIGLLTMTHALTKLSDDNQLPVIFGIILSTAMIIIGVGSAFYHASMTFWGQFIDVGGMYLLVSFMLIYAWMRLYKMPIMLSAALYIIMNTALFLLLYFIPDTRRILFALVLLLGIGFEIYYAMSQKLTIERYWFYYGLVIFVGAYGIWLLDNNRLLCDADSLLQGHAVWHILGAVSSGMLYLYYASEMTAKPLIGDNH